MKYPNLTSLLDGMPLNLHSGLFGVSPHARLTEESLQKLEDHLSEKAGVEVQQQLDQLQNQYNALKSENTSLQNAVVQALELNGMRSELPHDATATDAVVLLGNKCKEYGGSENRHSFVKDDGQESNSEKLINGYIDPNAEHNQIIAKLFNR